MDLPAVMQAAGEALGPVAIVLGSVITVRGARRRPARRTSSRAAMDERDRARVEVLAAMRATREEADRAHAEADRAHAEADAQRRRAEACEQRERRPPPRKRAAR